jgi:hypothetical protein
MLQSDEGLLEILKEGLTARRREIVALGCHSLRPPIVGYSRSDLNSVNSRSTSSARRPW